MKSSKLVLTTVVSELFEENCYIAQWAGRNDCVVIDPGLEPDKILAELDVKGLTPAAILNTHGHSDHIAGNAALKERWPNCPLVIGAGDAPKLTSPLQNLSAAFGFRLVSPAADTRVTDGSIYRAGGFEFDVLAIPGHSVGHVVYLCKQPSPQVVFVGDVIFAGSIGRTDFPDGDLEQLLSGIRAKLFTLPDETVLLSGHGPATTVGQEKRTNPFVSQP